MSWHTKYLSVLGDFTKAPDGLFADINRNLKRLERSSVDVSFIFIAHNEEDKLLAGLWSVSEMQTDLSVEVIVVNNASTDRTQELIEKTGVRTVFQPKLGYGYARQAGTEMARGRYHFSADADTLYPPTYIDVMVKYLSKENVSVVYSPYGFYSAGKKNQLSLTVYEFFRDIVITLRSYKRPELCAGGAAMAFYTEQAKEVGWRTDILRGEDGSMLLSLKKYGNPLLVLDKKARVKSSSRALDADGTFAKMVVKRLWKDIRRIPTYFTKVSSYKDQHSNLSKKE
jgi:glycosyltransferase involved in cell wall biosynthesis